MKYLKSIVYLLTIILVLFNSCGKENIRPDVITDPDKNIKMTYLYDFTDHYQYVFYTDFSPDSKYLASGSADRQVILWDINNSNKINSLQEEYDEIWGIPLKFSSDGKYLVIGSFETLKVISVKNDFQIMSANFAHKKGIQTLDISPDNKYIATAGVDGKIIIWSLPDLKKIREIQAHVSEIWNISISPDGKYLLSGGQDSLAKQWSFPDLTFIQELRYHSLPIEYVDISSDGENILLASADSTISIWKTRNLSTPFKVLTGHIGSVLVARFSMDNRYVFSGGDDDEIYVFEVETGEVKERLQRHFGDIMTISVSRNGKYMASGSRDRKVKIWGISYQ